MARLKLRRLLIVAIILIFLYLFTSVFFSHSFIDQDDSTSQSILHHEFHHREENDMDKKDWHDINLISEENKRSGPGEKGQGVVLTEEERKSRQYSDLLGANGFNALASDKISLNRSLNDLRHPLCQTKKYLKNLPTVSIVIPFHDEHLSTLLRSIHSIVKRTPPELLHEIILVDDLSTKGFLGQYLENYIRDNFKKGLVKLIRNKEREGLIRTRMAGADISTGEIIIFFDSHIEPNVNWLPPLIEPIVENPKICVCPFIDVISDETFALTAQDEGARGAFDWQLFYKRIPLVKDKSNDPTKPFENPVMAGGLFAINRDWFYHLGGYDKGLEIWGGEQYELSFKIWQCGGKILDAPCSRVGHIYRKFNPFSMFSKGDYLTKNYKRVAEVWMDEYKEFIYKKRPLMRHLDAGDISEQVSIRNKLKCKPFKWFMDVVAYDLTKFYPPVPVPPYASGKIKNAASMLCIETLGKARLTSCDHAENYQFTFRSDIRTSSEECFDVSTSNIGDPVTLYSCHGLGGNQKFKYDLKSSHLYHVMSNQCLDSNEKKEVFMNKCISGLKSQEWNFGILNREAIIKEFTINFLKL